MIIRYTKHAERDKFSVLARHGFVITKKMVRQTVEDPDHLELIKERLQMIASKKIDDRHVLRVVYRMEGDIIVVITFYPAEMGRYYL